MRYLDFIGQSLIILFFAGWAAIELVSFRTPVLIILMAQLVLGPWQMLSSLFSVLTESPFHRLKIVHFLVAIIYLLILVILSGARVPENILVIAATVPAWTLAFYYYHLTWRWAFMKTTKSGSFLPNIFF
jgi:hypothetical protein